MEFTLSRRPQVPDGLPVLSRGSHRSPHKGACFMEFASYLAGERWSDHPACTHALLAQLARTVNDLVDDEHRAELVPLIPEVVGLNARDPLVDLTIAGRAAIAALPVAAEEYQHGLAVGLLTIDRVCGDLEQTREVSALRRDVAEALAIVPGARGWATAFSTGRKAPTIVTFTKLAAPRIVAYAGLGIARALIMDPDERLVALLRTCIADTQRLRAQELGTSYAAAAPAAAAATAVAERAERVGADRVPATR